MTYLVMDKGDVQGVFDDPDLAEEFRRYYNYDDIVEYCLNPQTPEFEGFKYRLSYNFADNMSTLRRVGNNSIGRDEWYVHIYDGRMQYCALSIVAVDYEHARKIAANQLAALKAGTVFSFHQRYEREAVMEDGQPTAKSVSIPCIDTYQMVSGELQLIHTERII